MKRGERENSPRDIQLSVPVVNIGVLQPEIHRIEQILRKLSSDSWTVMLRQVNGMVEKPISRVPLPGKPYCFRGLDWLRQLSTSDLPERQLQLVSRQFA